MSENTAAVRPFTAASFDQYLAEQKLMAARCSGCGAIYIPPRPICPGCHGEALEWHQLVGKGRLAAFTVIYSGPSFMVKQGFDRRNPYISGIVTLEEGPSISARILGLDPGEPSRIQVGTPLHVEFVEVADGEAKTTYLSFRA